MPYLQTLLTFISDHPILIYALIFAVSLSESLAIIGSIVPGTTIIVTIGAITATGRLNLELVLIMAMAGAVVGDGFSYWLGWHYHQNLKRIWPFSRYPAVIEKGELFFQRHGGKSILFGRFFGPVRSIIPIVAGMLSMQPLRFIIVNVFSAIAWGFAYILPGYFLGVSLLAAGVISMRLIVLLILLAASLWLFLWLSRKLIYWMQYTGSEWIVALEDWIASDKPVHGIRRFFKSVLSVVFLRKKGEELLLTFLIVLLLLGVWGFVAILQSVFAGDLTVVDQSVYHFMLSLRTQWTDRIFIAISELGDPSVNICVAFAVLLLLLIKRCYRTAKFWLLAILGGLFSLEFLRWLFLLPGNIGLNHAFANNSTAMSVIVYGFLAVLVAKNLSNTFRWSLFAVVFLVSFLIAFSRLFLGVHMFSEVLAGFFLGAMWIALLGIAYLKKEFTEKVPRVSMIVLAALVLTLFGGWHVSQNYNRDLALYAPRKKVVLWSQQDWIAGKWRKLPTWRIDMGDEKKQPLTLQFAGSPKKLAEQLKHQGWKSPPEIDLKTLLGVFSSKTTIDQLPLLPMLNEGREDVLRLVRHEGKDRWVLRLWKTDVEIVNDGTLYVGTVETERRYHLGYFFFVAKDAREYDAPLLGLDQMIKNPYLAKWGQRKQAELQKSNEEHQLNWNGKVLLLILR